jgi:hypothetical protein
VRLGGGKSLTSRIASADIVIHGLDPARLALTGFEKIRAWSTVMSTVEVIYQIVISLPPGERRRLLVMLEKHGEDASLAEEDDDRDALTGEETEGYMKTMWAVTDGLTEEEKAIVHKAALDRSGWERSIPAE